MVTIFKNRRPPVGARPGWGYPLVLVIMAGLGVGMRLYFRRQGWLGGSPRDER